MYSHEIQQLLELRNYLLNVKEYFNICDTSPQIKRVSYDPYEDIFKIETYDGYKFEFKVKPKEKERFKSKGDEYKWKTLKKN